MTITNAMRLVVATGNGATTEWPFSFLIPTADELKVTVFDGFVNTVISAANYSVTGIGNAEGGTVTYPLSGAPLAASDQIIIERVVQFVQPTTFANQQRFFPTVLEASLDRLVMQTQQLAEILSRAPTLPPTASTTDIDELYNAILVANENIASILAVNGALANVNTVAANIANVNTVGGISAAVSALAAIETALTNLNAIRLSIVAVEGNAANISAVAAIDAAVSTVSAINAAVTTVAGIDAEVVTVAGIAGNVTTVAGVAANVTTVAGIAANVTTVAGVSAAVSTVATNVADVTNFADVYLGPAAANPALRNDGSALQSGDLYFNTVVEQMQVYNGTAWVAASSAVNGTALRQSFTATAAQTTFAITGGYDAGFADVYLNGVKLVNGTDVNVSSGVNVVLTVGATAGDSVDVVAYGAFEVANTYTQAEVNSLLNGLVATYGGAADAITLSTGLALTSLPDGLRVRFRATAENTGAATINLDGLGAKAVRTITGVALPAGYIRLGNTGAAVETVVTWSVAQDAWIADRETELGSNANGYFERLANGKLTVWMRNAKDNGSTNAQYFDFPVPFIAAADIGITIAQTSAFGTRSVLEEEPEVGRYRVRVANVSDGLAVNSNRTHAAVAIGRWY